MIIAVDGPAASGKGTIARRLAARFGLSYLDTGLIYRAVAWDVLRAGYALDNREAAIAAARSLDPAALDDPRLRDREIGEAASVVAAVSEVRAALLEYQRVFAARPPGAVIDGRDIGTVVCPHADVKLFITAALEVRAARRLEELRAQGEAATFAEVCAAIAARDDRDRRRSTAPLLRAADAILLDTSNLDIENAVAAAVGLVERTTGR